MGGGILFYDANPILKNTIIENNTCNDISFNRANQIVKEQETKYMAMYKLNNTEYELIDNSDITITNK